MSRRQGPDVIVIVLGAVGAAVVAAGTFGLLNAASRPAALNERLKAAETTIQTIEHSERVRADTSVYAAHALCRTPLDQAGGELHSKLVAAAAEAGLNAPRIEVAAPEIPEAGSRLTPVTFTIQAFGQYPAVIDYLQRLSRLQPQVFADTADLQAQTSQVGLKLTGRIVCEAPAA